MSSFRILVLFICLLILFCQVFLISDIFRVDRYIYIYIYIYIHNLHNGECASVFNALFKTRRVSAFAFLRGLNMQLLQSRNWLIV